jgi:hypothetical protein
LSGQGARDVSAIRYYRATKENRVRNGTTESYAGFFDIPEKAPRLLFIANAAPFTSVADVDRLADTIEAAARAA